VINRLKYKWNCLQRDAGWQLGLKPSCLITAKGARILVYHGVCPQDHLRFNTLFLKLKTFEAHLRFYKKYYNIISLDDFYEQRFLKNKFNVCLSFDDGFANNYKYVLPLLQQYKVPATFFITGIREAGYDILWNDFLAIATLYGPRKVKINDNYYEKVRGKYISVVNKRSLSDILRASGFVVKSEALEVLSSLVAFRNDLRDEDYWRQMDEKQLQKLSACPRVTIGSHGYYHNDLSQVSLEQAKDEMSCSKKYLENITGKEIKALAFPYGAYTHEVKEEAKKIGYSQLLATSFILPNDREDTTLRGRLTINPFISVVNQMYANVTGLYSPH
jgi:peptidoglycan/xylan/chitin deacetylase (PgdA/CDA1 family)